MNGSSRSILIADDEDRYWVLKLVSTLQGKNVLANEVIGTRLCAALGLPVPEHAILSIPTAFLEDPRTWFSDEQNAGRPLGVQHFGSRFLPSTTAAGVVEFLPKVWRSLISNPEDEYGMCVFDLWSMHADRRQALYTLQPEGIARTYLDFSHIFGGPGWSQLSSASIANHARLRALYTANPDGFEPWVIRMKEVIPDLLGRLAREIPAQWYSGDLSALCILLRHRLFDLRQVIERAIECPKTTFEVECESERDTYLATFLRDRGASGWL